MNLERLPRIWNIGMLEDWFFERFYPFLDLSSTQG